MRSARTARRAALLAGWAALACLVGCSVSTKTEADAELAAGLEGRWRGEAIDVPESAWWWGTTWDVSFSNDGLLSAVAQTVVDARPRTLRFKADFAVRDGLLIVEDRDDSANLLGWYRVHPVGEPVGSRPRTEPLGDERMVLERIGDGVYTDAEDARLRLRLKKVFGS